jgi:chromosomal replication initiation ATPase DnaA
VTHIRNWLQNRLPDREVPVATRLRKSHEIEDVVRSVCTVFGVEKDQLFRRGSRKNRPRAIALYLCCSRTHFPVRELGRYFGGISGQAVSNATTKIPLERTHNHALNQNDDLTPSSTLP